MSKIQVSARAAGRRAAVRRILHHQERRHGLGLSLAAPSSRTTGKLWAEQNDGLGATFFISIPASYECGTRHCGAIFPRPTRGAHDLMRNAE